ncbi:hypothetical protein IE81DRAFT_126234 [Ceraceosorus guamensis]|uniref:Uncharacterized protein n=1 Tax=Ceraceosorus guamensis TaxID=1522189 RepID=A0A316W7D2_9BASI|nr:hypothetical protein IE81DRAFT_126234 [Ceraceosorus guamensis]PWN45777.1 hypothetical protein IE81DRAFT_126234 [Ceraceosorus guamensis]
MATTSATGALEPPRASPQRPRLRQNTDLVGAEPLEPPKERSSAEGEPASATSPTSLRSYQTSGFTTRFGTGWMAPTASSSQSVAVEGHPGRTNGERGQPSSDAFIDMVRRSSSQQSHARTPSRPLLRTRSPSSNGSKASADQQPGSPIRSKAPSISSRHSQSPKSESVTLTMSSPRYTSMMTSRPQRRSSLAPSEAPLTQDNAALSDMAYFSMRGKAEEKAAKAGSSSSVDATSACGTSNVGTVSPGSEVTLVPISEDGRSFRFVERSSNDACASLANTHAHSRSRSDAAANRTSMKAASVQSWLKKTTDVGDDDAKEGGHARDPLSALPGERHAAHRRDGDPKDLDDRRASDGSAGISIGRRGYSSSSQDNSSADWMSTDSASSASSLHPAALSPHDLRQDAGDGSSCPALSSSPGLTDAGDVSTSDALTEASSLPTPSFCDGLEVDKDPLHTIERLHLDDACDKWEVHKSSSHAMPDSMLATRVRPALS